MMVWGWWWEWYEGGGVGGGKGGSESVSVGGCDVSDMLVVIIMMWMVVMWNDCF